VSRTWFASSASEMSRGWVPCFRGSQPPPHHPPITPQSPPNHPPIKTVAKPVVMVPPWAVASPTRAAGRPLMRTVAEPLTMAAGGPTHRAVSPITAAGRPPMSTVGAPGPDRGPPTWGTGGWPGVKREATRKCLLGREARRAALPRLMPGRAGQRRIAAQQALSLRVATKNGPHFVAKPRRGPTPASFRASLGPFLDGNALASRSVNRP